jgi:hypothetical protein
MAPRTRYPSDLSEDPHTDGRQQDRPHRSFDEQRNKTQDQEPQPHTHPPPWLGVGQSSLAHFRPDGTAGGPPGIRTPDTRVKSPVL